MAEACAELDEEDEAEAEEEAAEGVGTICTVTLSVIVAGNIKSISL